MLVRCAYASRSADPITKQLLGSILEESRKRNQERGVTGFLCISGDIFIQVLEGGRDAISELFIKIACDPRHTNVRLIAYEEIGQRKYGNWSMGQVDLKKINPSLLLKYHETAELDPFTCSGSATMALLDELVSAAAILGKPSA